MAAQIILKSNFDFPIHVEQQHTRKKLVKIGNKLPLDLSSSTRIMIDGIGDVCIFPYAQQYLSEFDFTKIMGNDARAGQCRAIGVYITTPSSHYYLGADNRSYVVNVTISPLGQLVIDAHEDVGENCIPLELLKIDMPDIVNTHFRKHKKKEIEDDIDL